MKEILLSTPARKEFERLDVKTKDNSKVVS